MSLRPVRKHRDHLCHAHAITSGRRRVHAPILTEGACSFGTSGRPDDPAALVELHAVLHGPAGVAICTAARTLSGNLQSRLFRLEARARSVRSAGAVAWASRDHASRSAVMQSAGLWMLIAVAAAMVATGLPAWIVLLGVALLSCIIGLAAGAFDLALLGALPSRVLGLLENDLLQAMPLYVFMGALLNRLPLAEILMRVGSRVLRRTGAGTPLAGLGLG